MTAAEFAGWRRSWIRPPQPDADPLGRSAAHHTLVMGVLNVTPDSFSDGGAFFDPAAAAAHAEEMIAAGADLIDIGGESTRPGSAPVAAAEQIRRVLPALQAIRRCWPIAISIDTTQSAVAAAALDGGADCINDISGGRDDPALLPLAGGRGVPVVLMHMQGTPATMQRNPQYGDVVAEVAGFLAERREAALAAGVAATDVLLDPGIGFGKTVEHNLLLLRELPALVKLGSPVVIGTSRKGFLRALWSEAGSDNGQTAESARSLGTAATVAWACGAGAGVVRVHEVGAARGVVRIIEAIRRGTPI